MRYIIDRFENEMAILEDENKKMSSVNIEKLPPEVKEGNVLLFENQRYSIDYKSTENRKEKIQKIIDDLWE